MHGHGQAENGYACQHDHGAGGQVQDNGQYQSQYNGQFRDDDAVSHELVE